MFIITLIIMAFSFGDDYSNQIIARVGDKVITAQDFIERAEYTPRPLYCRGNSSTDKRIILNSLIGEKLFSMEMKKDIPIEIDKYLIGRRNQKMREMLFNTITSNAIEKINNFSHWKSLSAIEYNISYLSISNSNLLSEIQNSISIGKSLSNIYASYNSISEIPKRENINLFSAGNRALREELFSKVWDRGDIIGPIKTDDNVFMFVQIDSRKKIVNLNQSASTQLDDELTNLIASHIKETEYQKFVSDIMSEMKFDLNPASYIGFSESIRSWYNEISEAGSELNKISPRLNISSPDEILLVLNGEDVTIKQISDWMSIHPLVFRDGYYKDLHFSDQLKYAIADLIRDRNLNDRAISLNLHRHPEVISEYEKWYDNYRAIAQRKEIIDQESEFNSTKVTTELNEYFFNVSQKYSEQIGINLEVLDSISLSSIDMATYNNIGPYKLAVPLFPVITNTYKLNYGQPISMENYE